MFIARSEYDRGINTFSPEGRLFQVEYSLEAIKLGSTAIGIQTSEGVVLGVEKRVTSTLLETSSVEKIVEIDKHIGCAISGLQADSRTLVEHARVTSQSHAFNYAEPLSVESCTQSICDLALRFGEGAEGEESIMSRPFGVALLIGGWDEDGPALYHAEPSGTFYRYDAKAIGSGSEGAQAELVNEYHKSLTLKEAEKLTLSTLKQVMEEKLDAKNVQLASITKDKGFRIYSDEEMKTVVGTLEESDIVPRTHATIRRSWQTPTIAQLQARPTRPISSGPNSLLDLAPELLINVFACLPAKEVQKLRNVNKHLQTLIDTNAGAIATMIRGREIARLNAHAAYYIFYNASEIGYLEALRRWISDKGMVTSVDSTRWHLERGFVPKFLDAINRQSGNETNPPPSSNCDSARYHLSLARFYVDAYCTRVTAQLQEVYDRDDAFDYCGECCFLDDCELPLIEGRSKLLKRLEDLKIPCEDSTPPEQDVRSITEDDSWGFDVDIRTVNEDDKLCLRKIPVTSWTGFLVDKEVDFALGRYPREWGSPIRHRCAGICTMSELTSIFGVPPLPVSGKEEKSVDAYWKRKRWAEAGRDENSVDAYWVRTRWAEAEIKKALRYESGPLKMAMVVEEMAIS